MFKNYLLLSLKVLKRKPLYTFISLFGISFTLMILMLLTSLTDATLGANKPMSNRDRLVLAPMVNRTRVVPDTTLTVDSIKMDNGRMRLDSSYTYGENEVSNSNGPMGYKFITENLAYFDNAEYSAFYSDGTNIDGFLDGRKFTFNAYFVNTDYWEVFDFEFVHGGPLPPEDEAAGARTVVITDKSSETYFGEVNEAIIGQEMVMGEEIWTVRGIVKRPWSDSPFFAGDVFAPITASDPRSLSSDEIYGGFGAVFLTSHPDKRQVLQDEINFFSENYDMSSDEWHNKLEIYNAKFIEGYAQGLLNEEDPVKAVRMLFIPVGILLLLFVALPLINLVNLNISRVYERKSEIGVRKAFGADAGDILYQFVFENMIITLIGGIIGLVLAVVLIDYVNTNDLLGITRLAYSFKVFGYFIVVIIVFGLLSGILPAYRMSRTNVANSLR